MPFQKTNPMSRRALLPLIAAAALSPALLVPSVARAQGVAWQIYRPEGLGFEVDMPGKPKITVEDGERDDPWVRSINAELDVEQITLGVSHQEFRQPFSLQNLSATQRMGMESIGFRIARETALTLNGVPGFELLLDADSLHGIMRAVVVKNNLILVSVMGDQDIQTNATVRRFLDSFKPLP